jgi:hypothetical protein
MSFGLRPFGFAQGPAFMIFDSVKGLRDARSGDSGLWKHNA